MRVQKKRAIQHGKDHAGGKSTQTLEQVAHRQSNPMGKQDQRGLERVRRAV